MTSFFEEQAELIRQLGSAETAETRYEFAKLFDWLAEQTTQARPKAEPGDGDEDAATEAAAEDLPEFIHLRAATVHAPGTAHLCRRSSGAVALTTLAAGRLATTVPGRPREAEQRPESSDQASRGRVTEQPGST
jgi:hypothetical protein